MSDQNSTPGLISDCRVKVESSIAKVLNEERRCAMKRLTISGADHGLETLFEN
jgi:hypothetical protein